MKQYLMQLTGSLAYIILFIFTLVFTTTANAHNSDEENSTCVNPTAPTDIRPIADGPPTEISTAIVMLDLMEIDDISQTLKGDFAVILIWTDPRLVHLEGCEIHLDHIWSPGLVFLNSGRKFKDRPEVVSIEKNGQVVYVQRYSGTFATYHDLRDFPFDDQVFSISLVSLELSEKDVQLVVNDKETYRREKLNISDWNIGEVSGSIGREHVPSFDIYHSRYDFNISAHRIQAYYLWKVLIPLSLIVAMSWCVFWINPAQYGPQIGLSATSMLTLIAFIFATSTMVPALGYLTRLDIFIVGSTILVFLALLESLTTIHFVSHNKEESAMRIDRVSRILFPLAFAALIMIVYVL